MRNVDRAFDPRRVPSNWNPLAVDSAWSTPHYDLINREGDVASRTRDLPAIDAGARTGLVKLGKGGRFSSEVEDYSDLDLTFRRYAVGSYRTRTRAQMAAGAFSNRMDRLGREHDETYSRLDGRWDVDDERALVRRTL